MPFYPSVGDRSVNDFSSDEGVVYNNPTLQGITGGYVTLLPINNNVNTFISTWTAFSGWSMQNSMHSVRLVTGDFTITGQAEHGITIPGNTGTQQNITTAGAWNIQTPMPILTGSIYSGVASQCLLLYRSSPDTQWFTYFDQAGTRASLEFDVASFYDPYSGSDVIIGFTTGQNNLTGLSAKSGILGHGVYICDGDNWDFIEVLPYGIRSTRHPEHAIPMDLTSPKRFRIGIDNNDLHIISEDGRSISAYGKFDTLITPEDLGIVEPAIAIGAPPLSGDYFKMGSYYNVKGFVGNTYWADFKLVTGSLVLQTLSGERQYYSTQTASLYTDVFDPKIQINNFISAVVDFTPFAGGNTTVTAQYSGFTGFIDGPSVTIDGQSVSPVSIDMTSIPIRTYSNTDLENNGQSNSIRFKIQQVSTFGKDPSPTVSSITILASKSDSYLNIVPNWKRTNESKRIQLFIDTGSFYTSDPKADVWTSLLINVPGEVGVKTGSLIDQSLYNSNIQIIGTGEIVPGGRFGYAFNNYQYVSGTAISGSSAATYLGLDPVDNFFPNPLFDQEFRPVNLESNYVTGKVFGNIASHMFIPTVYTGRSIVTYEPIEIYRPEIRSRIQRLNLLRGNSNQNITEYSQRVIANAYDTGVVHDGSVGIEARIPSGIATSNMLVDMDLQISQGSGLYLYVSGAATSSNWQLNGPDFRVFRQISFPVSSSTTGEIRIGLTVPSGYSSSSVYDFSIDNLTVSPINSSYFVVTGISGFTHKSGVISQRTLIGTYPCTRAATVFNTDIYLNSYPASRGTILQITGYNGYGLSLFINNSGYISGSFDLVTDAHASSIASQGFYNYIGRQDISSQERVPLGRWTNIGFIHETHTYNSLSTVNYSGGIAPTLVASTNRAYVTIDGYPVQSIDCDSGWYKRNLVTAGGDSSPVISYIPISGNTRAIIASGIVCSIDGLTFSRPPVADAEVELSIKGARATSPYFVPEYFFNGTARSDVQNVLFNTAWLDLYGYDTYLGSCYNFYSPGYTHWDHGPWRNHLLFSGIVEKQETGPYSGFGSTRFYSGSYAIAKYSSATERFINETGSLGFQSYYTSNNQSLGRMNAKGWFYPRSTGSIFSMLQSSSNFTGSRLELYLDTGNYIKLTRYNSTGLNSFTIIGNQISLNSWNWIGFDYTLSNLSGDNITGVVVASLFNHTGLLSYRTLTGLNYPFRYRGHTGDTESSAFLFARNSDMSLCDWAISCPDAAQYLSNLDQNGIAHYTGYKGGRYQAVFKDNTLATEDPTWETFTSATIDFDITTGSDTYNLYVAAHNAYDNNSPLNGGILLYSNSLFKEVESYHIKYDNSIVEQTFGSTDSPIRLGSVVPETAINIARVDSEEFTVDSSVNTIDLSDSNINNISSYKGGNYSIKKSNGYTETSSITGSFKGINSNLYSGRADLIISGAINSKNIELTTLSIDSPELSIPYEAFYCYLVGRGAYKVYLSNPSSFDYSSIREYYTGDMSSYFNNIEKLMSSISIKNSKGDIIPIDEYPYKIIATPYSVNDLYNAVYSGSNLYVDGISSPISGNIYSYSVLLLLNKKTYKTNDSAWIYYDAYSESDSQIIYNHKEIINPVPIIRQHLEKGDPEPGRFDIQYNTNSNQTFNIKYYGIASGYSGLI